MLEAKIGTQLQYNLGLKRSLMRKKILPEVEVLVYVVQPEDSSTSTDKGVCDMSCNQPKTGRDVIKTLFWLAVSIGVSITIAQLN